MLSFPSFFLPLASFYIKFKLLLNASHKQAKHARMLPAGLRPFTPSLGYSLASLQLFGQGT